MDYEKPAFVPVVKPSLTDNLAPMQKFVLETKELTRKGSEILKCDLVINGYQSSGLPAERAYMNVTQMAKSRLKKFFPLAQRGDPLFDRMVAECRIPIAERMVLKYKCRMERKDYDFIKDCNEAVARLISEKLDEYRAKVAALEAGDGQQ